MPFSEEKMVKGCLQGKPKFQRLLYEKYKVRLFMLCLRYAGNRMEAEDFLQEGFVKIFRDLHQFDSRRGSLSAWTQQVVRNTIFQEFRKKKLNITDTPVEDFADQISTDEDVFSGLGMEELTKLIQKLPSGYRTVFNMFIVDGYTHQEIASKLKISLSTSKSQLFKAKKMLRGQLQGLHLHISS